MSDGTVQLHGVLVTYRRPEALARSLRALGAQTRGLDTLVVVDNAPDPATKATLARHEVARHADYFASPENLGPAGGIAAGMTHALAEAGDDDWIVVLDDDDPLPPGVLERHLEAARHAPADVAAVGGGGADFDWRRGRLQPVRPDRDELAPADYLKSGWGPLYRVTAVHAAGVFDRRLFFGFDDLEYGLRLRSLDWRLLVLGSDGWPANNVSRASWRVGPVSWRRYYSLRNLIHLLRQHGRPGTALRVSLMTGGIKPLVNIPVRPVLAVQHLRMNRRAVRDGWRGRLGVVVAPDGR